jgi:dephospho-CoA kinase
MEHSKEKSGPLRVGLTGGIGSGKSTVCRIFESIGIPVYDADYWAKWLISNDPDLKSALIELLGTSAYLPDGSYNRGFVASKVFTDRKLLDQLNQLVHPAVARHGLEWHQSQDSRLPYTLKEAALMIESGSHRELDFLIVVTAPEVLRVERVMQRDGVEAEAVYARIRNQMPESEKVDLADFIIENDGNRLLTPQVWAIHRDLVSQKTSA